MKRTSIRGCVASALAVALLGSTSIAAAAPAAPTGLTAGTAAGGSGIALRWTDNSADETGFAVERCSGSNCVFGQIGLVTAGVVTFTDTFNPTGTTQYRVRSVNATGASPYSNTVDGPIFLSTNEAFAVIAASPVTGTAPLSVSFDGSGSSSLNGGIASYTWSFGDNLTATGVSTTYTYNYPGVYAASLEVIAGGAFPSADARSVIITVTAPPLAAASDLAASTPAKNQVLLTWTNPASSASSLALQRCSNAGCTSFKQLAALTLASIFYKDTTVRRGTTYRYRLAASNGTATVYSNIVQVQAR